MLRHSRCQPAVRQTSVLIGSRHIQSDVVGLWSNGEVAVESMAVVPV